MPLKPEDICYLRERAMIERQRAAVAADDAKVADAHRLMAERYEKALADGELPSTDWARG